MTDRFPAGTMAGSPGNQCNGSGECAAARLHLAGARCPECGHHGFDHDTETPQEAFCHGCGEPWTGEVPR